MRFGIHLSIVAALSVLSQGCNQGRVYDHRGICRSDVFNESYVHKYGIEVDQSEWSGRGKNGKIVSTLKSGVIVTTNYVDGYPEGETIYTFPHSGVTHRIETYSSGQIVMMKEMYPNGSPKSQVEHSQPNKKIVTAWNESGAPLFREEYHDGKLLEAEYYGANHQVESKIDEGNGVRPNRDEFGQLVSRDKFERGELMSRTVLYPNGSPKEIIPYQMGKVNGQRRTFMPGGEPKSIEGWEDDRQQGVTVVFQGGEKVAEVPYVNGTKNGIEYRYKDERFIVEEVNWKNGKKHGPCYTHIGEDTHTTWHYEGQEVQKKQYDRLTNPPAR